MLAFDIAERARTRYLAHDLAEAADAALAVAASGGYRRRRYTCSAVPLLSRRLHLLLPYAGCCDGYRKSRQWLRSSGTLFLNRSWQRCETASSLLMT